jgi:hypothetical protein
VSPSGQKPFWASSNILRWHKACPFCLAFDWTCVLTDVIHIMRELSSDTI